MDTTPARTWDALGDWWLTELAGDRAYEDEIAPIVMQLAEPKGRVLDVGCGEGRLMKVMRDLGASPVGVDISSVLLRRAAEFGPVVKARLPSLSWSHDDCFDGAVVCLVIEHLSDHRSLLSELGRVVRRLGTLVLVMNHPLYTAPESAPIEDPGDREVLWRPGRYFSSGFTDEPAGQGTVRFYHRTTSALLTAASVAGWDLVELSEFGVSPAQVKNHPALAAQKHIPRLLAVRWRKR